MVFVVLFLSILFWPSRCLHAKNLREKVQRNKPPTHADPPDPFHRNSTTLIQCGLAHILTHAQAYHVINMINTKIGFFFERLTSFNTSNNLTSALAQRQKKLVIIYNIVWRGRLQQHRVRCWDKFAQRICKVTQVAASLRNIND